MASPLLTQLAALMPLVVAPLAIGGVHRETQAVLWLLVALSAFGAGVSEGWRGWRIPRSIAWLAACVLGIGALQIVPLPPAILETLSPTAADWRKFLWATPKGVPSLDPTSWHPVALAPPDVALSIAAQLAYLLWFLVLLRVFRGATAARPLWILVGLGIASFGIALGHELFESSRILGLYSLRGRAAYPWMSTFVNSNFQACFYAVAGLTALGLATSSTTGGSAKALAVGAAFASLTGVCLTLSRGGMLMLPPAIAVWLLLSRRPRRSLGPAMLLVGLVVLSALGGAVYLDATELGRQWASGLASAQDSQATKWQLWGPATRVVEHFLATGVGRGGFRFAFDHFAPELTTRFSYQAPENWALHLASSFGLPAGVAIAVLGGRAALDAMGSATLASRTAAAAAALSYVLLHDLFDFSWSAPGVAMPVVALMAYLWSERLSDGDDARSRTLSLSPAAVAALGLLTLGAAGGVWSARDLTIDQDRRRLRGLTHQATPPGAFDAAFSQLRQRRPADFSLYWLKAEQLRRTPQGRSLAANGVFYLNRSLFLRPTHARSHLLAADFLRWAGHRDQSNIEYKLAVRHARDTAQERRILRDRIRNGATIEDLVAISGEDLGVQGRVLSLLVNLRGGQDAYDALRRMSFVERAGEDEMALRQAANVLLAVGRGPELRVLVDALTTHHPTSVHAWHWAALAARQAGKPERALAHIRRARGLTTDVLETTTMVEIECRLLSDQGEVAGFSSLLEELRSQPRILATIYGHRAAVLLRLGEHGRADDDLRKAIRLRPDWVGPKQALADMLVKRGRRREALQLYEEALRIKPTHPGALKGRNKLKGASPPPDGSNQ